MIPVLSGTAPAGVRVLIATRPVDFRRGADGLAATVQSVLRQDPFSGTIFVFRSKRADRSSPGQHYTASRAISASRRRTPATPMRKLAMRSS